MKIRIQSNSVRLRLSRTEVDQIGHGIAITESTQFPSGEFRYILDVHDIGDEILSDYAEGILKISINRTVAGNWSSSQEVGLKSNGQNPISILIEKDFQCLTERGEDESKLFPNPNVNC